MVRIGPDEVLSAGAARARQVRRVLRQLVAESDGRARARARVRVSPSPWSDWQPVLAAEKPDLLVVEWPAQLQAMGMEVDEILATSSCATAIVRGPLPGPSPRILVPVRGGPYAELAVRIALRLRPSQLTVLHLTSAGGKVAAGQEDAPFLGLERVLRRLPEVELQARVTADAAQAILEASHGYDAVVLGTSARTDGRQPTLGIVAGRLLQESPIAVIAVRTPRLPPISPSDETAGVEAISILVDKWFAENTYQADEFSDLALLLKLKEQQGGRSVWRSRPSTRKRPSAASSEPSGARCSDAFRCSTRSC
jgi:glucosyl-3-phosphoglycerate synthase